jgi:peptidoglycan/LPS O-acetylase OafA/YrhL
VLLVIMHHIHLRFVINHYDVDGVLPKVLNQVLFWSGYYAVITFFVISGFLITSLSVGRWGSLGEIHIGSFYGMRAARILPCLLLALLVLSILHLAGIPEFTIKPERASLGRALWAALTFHVNWLEGRHGYLPGNWDVLWSLSVEEAFYLLFPLACLIFRREQVLLLPLLCLIIAGPVNRTLLADQDPWGDYAYLSCMDGVAFGCVAALACARQRLSKLTLRIALALGTTVSSLVIVLCNEDTHSGLSRFGLNVTVLEAGIALMLLSFGSGVGNGALSRGTYWLRDRSQQLRNLLVPHARRTELDGFVQTDTTAADNDRNVVCRDAAAERAAGVHHVFNLLRTAQSPLAIERMEWSS